MQKQTAQPQCADRPVEFQDGLVATIGIHARQSNEARLTRNCLAHPVVGWTEVVVQRLERAHDGALDVGGIHPRQQLVVCLAIPEQRLADERERVDRRLGHAWAVTWSSNSRMLAEKTRSASLELKLARRTLWTSSFGRQPGPSDANNTRSGPSMSIARRILAGYGIADVSRYRLGSRAATSIASST